MVYLLEECYLDDGLLIGIFSSRRNALIFAMDYFTKNAHVHDLRIREWQLDGTDGAGDSSLVKNPKYLTDRADSVIS